MPRTSSKEAFVRFWRHQQHVPGEPMAPLVTSMRRTAIDLARRDTRRTTREQWADGGREDPAPFFEIPLEGDDRRAVIETALRERPDEQREVLVLTIWGDLTFDQVAEQLDLPPNTAASRYRYALAGLRRELTAADCHG
jgi:RNA polymerase sigma-70 factor (ECF subfamily)